MTVRTADADDHLAVMRVIDAAMLEADAATVEARIDSGDVLVADEGGSVLGAAVVEPVDSGGFVEAIAVRRSRRAQGVGTELIEAACARYGRLVAEFDPRVRPFYDSLGFEIEPADERESADGDAEPTDDPPSPGGDSAAANDYLESSADRLRGVREPDDWPQSAS